MSEYLRPVPVPDHQSAPFWQACREHRLALQKCGGCGTFRYPPRPVCPSCRSRGVEWTNLSGRGTVFSWITVVHPVPREVYAQDVPYVVALIDLEEGTRIASNIIGCDPAAVHGGMAVEVVFDDVTPEVTLPKFRPVAKA